jgi:hypothetical protein
MPARRPRNARLGQVTGLAQKPRTASTVGAILLEYVSARVLASGTVRLRRSSSCPEHWTRGPPGFSGFVINPLLISSFPHIVPPGPACRPRTRQAHHLQL